MGDDFTLADLNSDPVINMLGISTLNLTLFTPDNITILRNVIDSLGLGLGSESYYGTCDDLQAYSTVKITLRSPIDGIGNLLWLNKPGQVIAKDLLSYTASMALTKEYPTRARYFRFVYTSLDATVDSFVDMSLNIETLYKGAASTINVGDSKGQGSVGVVEGSYQTHYSDQSGASGRSIYTTLGDLSGNSLAYTEAAAGAGGSRDKSLFISLRDSDNKALTGTTEHNLYVHPSDAMGHNQASTGMVLDACSSGVALYLTGADGAGHTWSTTRVQPNIVEATSRREQNAVCVIMTDASGQPITRDNPIHVSMTTDSKGIATVDIQNGVTQNFVSYGGFAAAYVTIFNLFTYNNGPNTIWTKVYNMSLGMIRPSDLQPLDSTKQLDLSAYDRWIVCNVATPPGQSRDLSFPKGLALPNGMFIRSSVEHSYASSHGPGSDVLFVNANVYTDANVTFFIIVNINDVPNYLTIINVNDQRSLALSPLESDAIVWFLLQESGILVTPINGQYWSPYYNNTYQYIPLELYDVKHNDSYFGLKENGALYNIGNPNIAVNLESTQSLPSSRRFGAGSDSGSGLTKVLKPFILTGNSLVAVTIPALYRHANPEQRAPAMQYIRNSDNQYLTLTRGALSLTKNQSSAYPWQILPDYTLVCVFNGLQYALIMADTLLYSTPYRPGDADTYFKYAAETIIYPGATAWSVASDYPTCYISDTLTPETFTRQPTGVAVTSFDDRRVRVQTSNSSGPYLTVVDNALALTESSLLSYVWTITTNDVLCAVDGGELSAIVCNTEAPMTPLLVEPYNPNNASTYYTVSGPILRSHDNYIQYNTNPTWSSALQATLPVHFSNADETTTAVSSQYFNIRQTNGNVLGNYLTLVDVSGQVTLSSTRDPGGAFVWTSYGNNIVAGLTANKAYAITYNPNSNSGVGTVYAEPYTRDRVGRYYKWNGSSTGTLYCASVNNFVTYDGIYAKTRPAPASETFRLVPVDSSYTTIRKVNYNIEASLDKFLTTSSGYLNTDLSINANVWNILSNDVIVTVQGNYMWPMIYNRDSSMIKGEVYNPANVNKYCTRHYDTSLLTASVGAVKMVFSVDGSATFIPSGVGANHSVAFVPCNVGTTVNVTSILTPGDSPDTHKYVICGINNDNTKYVKKGPEREVPPHPGKGHCGHHQVLPTGHLGTMLGNKLHVFTDDNTKVTVRPYSPSDDMTTCYSYKDHTNGGETFKALVKGTGDKIISLDDDPDDLKPVAPSSGTKDKSSITTQTDNGNYMYIVDGARGSVGIFLYWTIIDNKYIGLATQESNAYVWTVLPGLNIIVAKGMGVNYGIRANASSGANLEVEVLDINTPELYVRYDVNNTPQQITNIFLSEITEDANLYLALSQSTVTWIARGSLGAYNAVTQFIGCPHIETNIREIKGTLRYRKQYATIVGGGLALTYRPRYAYNAIILYNDVVVLNNGINDVLYALVFNNNRSAIMTEVFNPLNVESYYKYEYEYEALYSNEQYISFEGGVVQRVAEAPPHTYFVETEFKAAVASPPYHTISYNNDAFLYVNASGYVDTTKDYGQVYVWQVLPNDVVVCITNNSDMWALLVSGPSPPVCRPYNPDDVGEYYLFSEMSDNYGLLQRNNHYINISSTGIVSQQTTNEHARIRLQTSPYVTSQLQTGYLTVILLNWPYIENGIYRNITAPVYLGYSLGKLHLSTNPTTWYMLPNMVIVNSITSAEAIIDGNLEPGLAAYDIDQEGIYFSMMQNIIALGDRCLTYYSLIKGELTGAVRVGYTDYSENKIIKFAALKL
jgi:hypothetical protein